MEVSAQYKHNPNTRPKLPELPRRQELAYVEKHLKWAWDNARKTDAPWTTWEVAQLLSMTTSVDAKATREEKDAYEATTKWVHGLQWVAGKNHGAVGGHQETADLKDVLHFVWMAFDANKERAAAKDKVDNWAWRTGSFRDFVTGEVAPALLAVGYGNSCDVLRFKTVLVEHTVDQYSIVPRTDNDTIEIALMSADVNSDRVKALLRAIRVTEVGHGWLDTIILHYKGEDYGEETGQGEDALCRTYFPLVLERLLAKPPRG